MATAPLVDKSRAQILMGPYAAGRPSILSDPSIHQRTQEFRRSLSARMAALDKKGMKEKMPPSDYYVSRKIDGEFSVLVCRGSESFLINPGGTVRVGLPVLDEVCGHLSKAGLKNAVLACELYVHRTDKRPRVHDVCRVARQPTSEKELDSLRLAVFDIIEIDGKPVSPRYADVYAKIESIFGKGK